MEGEAVPAVAGFGASKEGHGNSWACRCLTVPLKATIRFYKRAPLKGTTEFYKRFPVKGTIGFYNRARIVL